MDYTKYSSAELAKYLQNQKVKLAGHQARLLERKKAQDIQMGIKDINDKIWPFIFCSPAMDVLPQNFNSENIEITNEAGFIVTHISKQIWSYDENDDPVYVDPDDKTVAGLLKDVYFNIEDTSSSRKWMDNPVHLNMIGDGSIPYKLDNTFFMSPNQNLRVEISNNSLVKYRCVFSFHGVRFKDALIDSLGSFVQD